MTTSWLHQIESIKITRQPDMIEAMRVSLDNYGRHGWELVAVVPKGADEYLAFFKKRESD